MSAVVWPASCPPCSPYPAPHGLWLGAARPRAGVQVVPNGGGSWGGKSVLLIVTAHVVGMAAGMRAGAIVG